MAQESLLAPFNSVGFAPLGQSQGKPVNRQTAGYKTMGGIIDANDANNTGLIGYFGSVVSRNPAAAGGLFAIGCPAGYDPAGFILFDAGVSQNDPAKANYILNGLPITVVFEGGLQYTSAQYNSQTGTTLTPSITALPIFRANNLGTGTTPVGAVEYLAAGNFQMPVGWLPLPATITQIDEYGIITLDFDFTIPLPVAIPRYFSAKVTIAPTAAGTATPLLADIQVPAGCKLYITAVYVTVNGGVAVSGGGTILKIQDTSAVIGVTVAVAGLVANAFLMLNSANVTVQTPVSQLSGFTAGKGIVAIADANFAAGSTIGVLVEGFAA